MADKDQTAKGKIDYRKLCKTTKETMREDIRTYTTLRIRETVENGKGIKTVASIEERCKSMITALKERMGPSQLIERKF